MTRWASPARTASAANREGAFRGSRGRPAGSFVAVATPPHLGMRTRTGKTISGDPGAIRSKTTGDDDLSAPHIRLSCKAEGAFHRLDAASGALHLHGSKLGLRLA
jgi:hypothetical protein